VTPVRPVHYREKKVSATESASRASILYPRVVKIREEMSLNNYEEANRLLQEAFAVCGGVPELLRIQDQLENRKRKLYSMLSGINENIDKKYFYTANQELVDLKEEFPAYHNQMMEAKINQGLLAGKHLYGQAESAREEESIVSACMDTLEVCADYPGVMKLLERYPPRLNGSIRVTADSVHHCNYIKWHNNRKEPYSRYIILRKKDAKPFHNKDGVVLATVEENSYVDRNIVAGEKYYYGIYSVRCGTISNGLLATSGCTNYFEVLAPETKIKVDGIEITWDRIPTGAMVEIYRAKGYVPAYPGEGELLNQVTSRGCLDQSVVPGNVYGYRIYAVYLVNGEKEYSNGIALRVTSGMKGYSLASAIRTRMERVQLTYYFEVKKILMYPYKVLLHIEVDENVATLPPLIVVGDAGKVPQYKTAGEVVAMLPTKEVNKELVYAIKCGEIGTCRYLNLFLQRLEDNSIYLLTLKKGKSLHLEGWNSPN
ncbi:hypothetical protein, partial [Bacteroides sp. Phil13]|uniref:hypothetical protein n=1 Tax=Bacteroides sp. Phil13 TaxID=1929999 RepID=UPI00257C32CA